MHGNGNQVRNYYIRIKFLKAAICTKYGPPEVLQIKEVDKPAPLDNEVLIKVKASTVAAADYRVRGFRVPTAMWLPARIMMGLTKPKRSILGAEFSGVISEVGNNVSRFKKGDSVLGVSLPTFGAYGEYLCVQEDSPLVKKPIEIPWNEAAAIPIGAKTANYYLDKAKIQPGQKVLIYGASGSVGTYAIQIARNKGARVTGVCSKKNFELIKALGAEKVVDYNDENWHKGVKDYDVFFQAVDKCPFAIAETTLKNEATYINISNPMPSIVMLFGKLKKNYTLILAKDFPQSIDDLKYLIDLIAKEEIKVVIDSVFDLNNIIQAHHYVDRGHKRGNVVITISET